MILSTLQIVKSTVSNYKKFIVFANECHFDMANISRTMLLKFIKNNKQSMSRESISVCIAGVKFIVELLRLPFPI